MIETFKTIAQQYRQNEGNVVSLLQDTQEVFGYIPREAIDYFSQTLGIAPSRFFGVVTFYAQFRMRPPGRHKITACCGTACHVRGSDRILNSLRLELKLEPGEDTTQDSEFTLEQVNCVGACSIAPVLIVDKKVHGKAVTDKILKELRALKAPSYDEK
ncbi:MAG: NAD(P)H-dependent oxidoreductase subunit E [Nitrospirae bacterium]|nr:NAD(P)H-dependent oxidoreductase subunit E [Nitrospirota bacterium]